MRVLAFDYRCDLISVTISAECGRTKFSMEAAVAVQGVRKVVKEGFKMISLDGRHPCSAVH